MKCRMNCLTTSAVIQNGGWHAVILFGQDKKSKHFCDKLPDSVTLNNILKNTLLKKQHRHGSQTPEIHVIFKHWLACI